MSGNHFYKRISIIILLIFSISICSSPLSVNAEETKKYIPGGIPFGMSIELEGIYVSGYSDQPELIGKANPAAKSGVVPGDIIKSVNGVQIQSGTELTRLINEAGTSPLNLTVKRSEGEISIRATAKKCNDGIYRLGINIKDSIAGIGTVTYISADDGSFGGLGHGICDAYTGQVLPIKKGTVCDVRISETVKGQKGAPGEIRGGFSIKRTGGLLKNTDRGVFGILNEYSDCNSTPIETATKDEVRCGVAEMICTLDDTGPHRYSVVIESSNLDESVKTRNFIIKVTDNALLDKTGGIIQGMSGCPLIQNGKLIGAVTHVLINDPTRGYGIFIDNMMEASN